MKLPLRYRLLSLVGLLSPFLLTGRQTPTLTLNYVPSSSLTAVGNISVAAFTYGPAVYGNVRTNQIRTLSPLGNRNLNVDPPMDAFFETAVSNQLRFVGVHFDSEDKVLSGSINQLLINDFPFSSCWTLSVHYLVTSKTSGRTVYDNVKVTRREPVKDDEPLNTAMNEVIKLNLQELIKDPDFIKALDPKVPSS